jgi:hypothetical protein
MESITIEPIVQLPNRDNAKNSKEWRSCCFSINSTAVKYFTQVGTLVSLIIYSATMLVIIQDCNSQRNYSSLLLFCLGILAPSPKMN